MRLTGLKGDPSKTKAIQAILSETIKDRLVCMSEVEIDGFIAQAMALHAAKKPAAEVVAIIEVCLHYFLTLFRVQVK